MKIFQIPDGLDINKFPLGKLLKFKDLATDYEIGVLKKNCKDLKINENLLISDFDGDNIRDFTLSSGGDKFVLSAEDSDWDNDGVPNLIDNSVGKFTFNLAAEKIEFTNNYNTELDSETNYLKNIKNRGITVINSKGVKLDNLHIYLLEQILDEIPIEKFNLEIIHATEPEISYGNHSFFSYVCQSETLEIYTKKLDEYIKKRYDGAFAGVAKRRVVNSIVIPIIVHSISHELGHALNISNRNEFAKNAGWSFKEVKLKSKYLKNNRMKCKKRETTQEDLKFNGKSFKEWMALKKKYEQMLNEMIKRDKDPKKFKENASKLQWYTKTKKNDSSLQLSFLKKYHVPTYYSFLNPSEWFSEVFSVCVFREVNGRRTLDQATKFEHLIGYRPDIINEQVCSLLKKR